MKKLLLITGDIATGKSTFANILSKDIIRICFLRILLKKFWEIP